VSEPDAILDLDPASASAADATGGEEPLQDGKKKKKKKKDAGGRGVETLYRVLYRNHIELTSLADTKANMMVGINGLFASGALGFVAPRLADGRLDEVLPALIPLAGCALSLAFAILAARPRVASKSFTPAEVKEHRANLMFFGHFARLDPEVYVAGLREMEDRPELLHEQMARDVHALGAVLTKKYRMLRASYSALLATVLATAAGLLWRLTAQ
jgi:hypothetical protein